MNFKSFSRSLEQFFHTVGQNNFGNKIPEEKCKNLYIMHVSISSFDNTLTKIGEQRIDLIFVNLKFKINMRRQSFQKKNNQRNIVYSKNVWELHRKNKQNPPKIENKTVISLACNSKIEKIFLNLAN